jgi:hypothetical protein
MRSEKEDCNSPGQKNRYYGETTADKSDNVSNPSILGMGGGQQDQ